MVARQGNLNRMQVGVQDEQNRIQELSQPGMENMILQTDLQKRICLINPASKICNARSKRTTAETNLTKIVYNPKMSVGPQIGKPMLRKTREK